MSTYTQILYQLVFGSKDHIPFLSTENQEILFAYIAGILKNKSCHSYIVGGACNHIHIITHIHPTVCPAYLIKDIKEASHILACRERSVFRNFPGWQVGYSGFPNHGRNHGYLNWTPPASKGKSFIFTQFIIVF